MLAIQQAARTTTESAIETLNPLPPVSSTGGKTAGAIAQGLWALVDFFSCTFSAGIMERVSALVTGLLGEPEACHGLHSYEQGRRWMPGGAFLCWSPGRREAWLSLSGGAIRHIGHDRLYELLHQLQSLGVKPTRIDTTIDDERRRITLDAVRQAADAHQFAGYRRYDSHVDRAWEGGVCVEKGNSVRFGRRGDDGSGRSLLVYDKALESEGENPAIRWEVTWSGERAEVIWQILMQDELQQFGRFARRIGQAVRSSIEFVDRGTGDRVSRMQVLPWWESFAKLLGDFVETPVTREMPHLQRTLEALTRQYGPQLGYVFDILGPDGMQDLAAMFWAIRGRCNKRRYGEDVTIDLVAAFAWAGPPGAPFTGSAGPQQEVYNV